MDYIRGQKQCDVKVSKACKRLLVLTLTFISYVTLNVFLSLPEPLFLYLIQRIVIFNLIELSKGLNKIKCETTCADLDTPYIALSASYFFPLFLLRGV